MRRKWISTLLCAGTIIILFAGFFLPALADSKVSPGEIGPYKVGFINLIMTDESRPIPEGGRPIVAYIWYPADPNNNGNEMLPAEYTDDPLHLLGWSSFSSTEWEKYGIDPAYMEVAVSKEGPFPLVVFSTGWFAPATMYIQIGARLASHGFVVAMLTNYGDSTMGEPFDHVATSALNRALDVQFVITKILEFNETQGDLFYGAINADQIAASGHSLGGYAAMALAGGDDSVCDTWYEPGWPAPPETCVPVQVDKRIKVILLLDGSNQGLHFNELARIRIPTIGIGEEWSTLGGDSWQARQHAAIQGHPSYRVDVAWAVHQSFMSFCPWLDLYHDNGYLDDENYQGWYDYVCFQEPVSYEELTRLTTFYMIAFLKAHLVKEAGYSQILTPGYAIANQPNIEFFVTEKRNPNAVDEDWPGDYLYFMHQPGSEQARGPKDPPIGIEEIMPLFLTHP